jgi:putrescine aminotransferase
VIKEPNLLNELSELDKKHYLHPTSSIKQQQENGPAIIFSEGEGVYLKDVSGKKYIEAMSSLWNVNVGYGRKELGQVALEQMTKLAFSSSFSTFSHEPAIRLAAKLAEITPGNLTATFFTSGGSESTDTAFKLVRHYWKLKGVPERKKIISLKKGYHGVATGSTSATGISAFRDMTSSLAPDFLHAELFSTASLRELIEEQGPETIAAFIAEPVQGAGGVNIPPLAYFGEVRELCDEYGIIFIADEVITGFGRSGKMFGMEHWGVTPDVMCIAKGITSGYAQLGGVVISEKIHKELIELSTETLFHGFTYSGHPVACAVALKNLEIIEREQLVENARLMGAELLKGFKWLQSEVDIIGEVRGIGLLGGIEIVKDQAKNLRFSTPLAPKIAAEAAKRGLIFRVVVFDGSDTLVFAPPLVINKQEIEQIVSILYDSLHEVKKGL